MRGRAHRIRTLTVTALGAGFLAAVPLAAQTSGPALPSFAERVDVRVVNVEVVATDRRGGRVAGLHAGDFRLFVDGGEVPVDYFTEVSEGRAVARRQGGAEAVPALLAGEGVGRRILVFIDDYFAVPIYRNRVLAGLGTQLDLLCPEDRVAIVAFDGKEVELLAPWTGSTGELEAALDRAMDRSAYGLRRRSDPRRFDTPDREAYRIQGSSSFASIGFLGGRRRDSAFDLRSREEVEAQVGRVVRAAASTLRGFAQPSGRKVMLLLTGGWPAASAERADPLIAGSRRIIPEERFAVLEPLIGTANRLGYTLYPVDLQPPGGADLRGAEFGSRSDADLHGARREAMTSDSRDSLLQLALRTGGKSFEGAANRVAFRSILEDTRSYYWLGFTPRWQGDDRSHRLRIEVTRPGIRLRSRSDFTDLSRTSEMDLVLEGAQLFGTEIPGAALDAEVAAPRRAGHGRIRWPLTVRVPLQDLTLLPHGQELLGAVELRLSARDDTGAKADVPVRTLEVRRHRPPAAGEVEPWTVELKLGDRPHTLLVALVEPATGRTWSKRLELEP